MQELINQIVQKTGISAEKAQEVLHTVSGFVQQKFPQFSGPLNTILGGGGGQQAGGGNDAGSSNPLGGLGSKLGF
jgi:hypothetical protein